MSQTTSGRWPSGDVHSLAHPWSGEKLDNCLDELSNLCVKAEMIGPSFHQVTGQAHIYMNLYQQNTSPG